MKMLKKYMKSKMKKETKQKTENKTKNKIDEMIQQDIDSGKLKLVIKDRCFVCGRKIKSNVDSLVRYSKQGNTCDECFTCSGLSRSTVPKKAMRYKLWCLKLESLQNK